MKFLAIVVAAAAGVLAAGSAQAAQGGCRYERTTHHTVCSGPGPQAATAGPVAQTESHGSYSAILRNRNGAGARADTKPIAMQAVAPTRRGPSAATRTCVKNDLLAVNSCR